MRLLSIPLLFAALLAIAGGCNQQDVAMTEDNQSDRTEKANTVESNLQQATLGGGCFWCVEAPLLQLDGVEKAVSGYSGGQIPNPTYEQICTGTTGHAEVVQVTYDPKKISFSELLEVFFTIHDPTQLNRQGNDVGTQYRSVIYYHNDEQQEIAEKRIKQLEESKLYSGPIVTELSPLGEFYVAEAYHQDYYANNPANPYCRMVVGPKVEKVREVFAEKLRDEAN